MFNRVASKVPLASAAILAYVSSQNFMQSNVHAESESAKHGAHNEHAHFHIKPIKCEDGTFVVPWSAPSRDDQIKSLENEEYDVVVIGGGCVGSGVALEAATRGLKVALVEAQDFASGTSGRSTKLIHGGVRYLEQAFKSLDYEMYGLVKEALEERYHLIHVAPFMSHPLATLIPLYTWWEIPYMWVGTKVYDFIAGKRRAVPRSYYISADEAIFQFPMLNAKGLKGGIVYYDGQHNDARMNVLIALTAAQFGANIGNYLAVQNILKDDEGLASGVRVKDGISGKTFNIRAKSVINATGCFGDAIRKMDDPNVKPLILGSSGVHVILPDHFSPDKMGLIIPKTKDGRVLFFLPWEGSTICGTTESSSDITYSPIASEQEVKFILEEANRLLNREVKPSDVKAAWAGIRPLILDPSKAKEGKDSSKIARTHVVEVTPSGMVSVLGGKWTTYRRMAEDAVDALLKERNEGRNHKLNNVRINDTSVTQNVQLLGADRENKVVNKKYDRISITLRESYGFERDVAKHLMMNYGTRALQVAEITVDAPELAARLCPRYPVLLAEIPFAVEQEYALTVVDILARRTRLAFLNAASAKECIPKIIEIMAPILEWDSARCAAEKEEAELFLTTMMAKPLLGKNVTSATDSSLEV